MVSLDIHHKEAEDFIKLKAGEGEISKANLSLEIDDEFMRAVEKYYEDGEVVVLHESKTYNGHLVEYDIIPIKLYKLLALNSYDWGDPACLFTERFRNYNLMEYDETYQIETCNPCGEQPLPKDFSCNLGSLNLSAFVNNPYTPRAEFDYNSFRDAICIAVRALDTIIDENADKHALDAQKTNSLNYRNIGLGVMGYATMLFMLGIEYGSDDAILLTETIFGMLFEEAIFESNALADKFGTFPMYSDVIWQSNIIKDNLGVDDIESLKRVGIRNCSLISIAPAGSISTMLGVSGGCEPEFAIKYNRKTESLDNQKEKTYEIRCKALSDYQRTNSTNGVPSYFVSADDIPWTHRVYTQSIMQGHVDTAISSTVNLPQTTTVEEIEKIYLYAWKCGLKGITVFRDGCKRTGILSTNTPEQPKAKQEMLARGDVIMVDDDLVGVKKKLQTGCGSLHCLAFIDPVSGDIMETYLSKGSKGGCQQWMVAGSRLMSYALRVGGNIDDIVDQLNSCGVCPSYAVRTAKSHDTSPGCSCPSAVGVALKELQDKALDNFGEGFANDEQAQSTDTHEVTATTSIEVNNPCPECGHELMAAGGCFSCICGFSLCS
jgi:ribonucleoside-diphosphate reductase alpha chain